MLFLQNLLLQRFHFGGMLDLMVLFCIRFVSSDPVCVVKDVGNTKDRKAAKIIWNPGDAANKAKRALKMEEKQTQLLTLCVCVRVRASEPCIQDTSSTHENLDSGCIEQIQFVELDLGLGFLICNCFACCSFKSLLCKVFEGGMQDLIFIHFPFVFAWLRCFFLRLRFPCEIYQN